MGPFSARTSGMYARPVSQTSMTKHLLPVSAARRPRLGEWLLLAPIQHDTVWRSARSNMRQMPER